MVEVSRFFVWRGNRFRVDGVSKHKSRRNFTLVLQPVLVVLPLKDRSIVPPLRLKHSPNEVCLGWGEVWGAGQFK